jgi:hypothetical protein
MSTHFKWYPSSEEVIVPWNAQYSFPSQANRAQKLTPRIPPKNGMVFTPGNVIRVEFPAQGYVNPINTTLAFDVALYGFTDASSTGASAVLSSAVRFQNNISSIFSRVRLLYGATPIEDIINYDVIVRCLSEWTGTNQNGVMDQTSISDGIGGYSWGNDSSVASAEGIQGNFNTRQKYIQGKQSSFPGTLAALSAGGSIGFVPNSSAAALFSGAPTVSGTTPSCRRYQINFALGLMTQDKLIPVKFMASQLAIELTLNQPQSCIYVPYQGASSVGTPTYAVGNVSLIPEILEFDNAYDQGFLKGLSTDGVPIKFSSWHTFVFGSGNGSNVNLLIQERSKSVKALFAVQRRPQGTFLADNGATYLDTSSNGLSTLQNYQFRIGGRYFPAAPVQVSTNVGSAISNGGCEAYLELQKALNQVGDFRLSTSCNVVTWGLQNFNGSLQDTDYSRSLSSIGPTGVPVFYIIERATNAFSGTLGSQCFAMAIDLETSNGLEISGLNAEEQSDIALIANWTRPQVTGVDNTPSSIEVYSYFDAMMILKENNVSSFLIIGDSTDSIKCAYDSNKRWLIILD